MKKKKKEWSAPALIILVRGKPEEKVLMTCKYYTFMNGGEMGANETCNGAPGCEVCLEDWNS